MNTRDNIRVEGVPYVWKTNLTDDEVRDFCTRFADLIATPTRPPDLSQTTMWFPLRFSFLEFGDGICLWSASGEKHTVLYRSHEDVELWKARNAEIDELREEQAAEQMAERELILTEDRHLHDRIDAALHDGRYEEAAVFADTRQRLRVDFGLLKGLPVCWRYWYAENTFARFPSSKYAIEFIRKYSPTAQAYEVFAHWFEAYGDKEDRERIREIWAIYKEGLSKFPNSGHLAKTACLFWRRKGRYEEAIRICTDAIAKGLEDGTKSGFVGRLERLRRECQRSKGREV